MAFFTNPPNRFAASGRHAVRRQRSVFCGVPLSRQIRPLRGQIRFPRPGQLPGAVGASAAPGGAGIYRGLPFMTAAAPPPYLLAAAVRQADRGAGSVFDRMPLLQQADVFCSHTVVIQRFSHSIFTFPCGRTLFAGCGKAAAGSGRIFLHIASGPGRRLPLSTKSTFCSQNSRNAGQARR